MRESWSCVKDSGYFLKTTKNIGKILKGAILFTADVFRLYPNILHGAGLEALRKRLNEKETPIGYLLKN